jgi:hypothetical protein
MTGRRWGWIAVALAAACAPGNPGTGTALPDPRTGGRPQEPGSAGTTGAEFGVTHHAHIRGTVTGRDGQPLAGVQVVTDRLLPPATASMPRNRATTAADGSFTVPAQATLPGDSARVRVMLVGFGFPFARGDQVPADSVGVPVTMVRTTLQPNVYTVRLTLPVARP